jgi:sugar/nucleoside kinase (ribokinase family)
MDSSYTVVVAPPNIDRIFLHNPGTNNQFGPEDLDSNLITKCRHFHFGYPPLMRRMFEDDGRQLQQVFQIAKQAGATTSLDMSLPDPSSPCGQVNWRKVLGNVLPHVDIFLPSIEETFYMLHPDRFLELKQKHQDAELINVFSAEDYSSLADEVLALGAKMVSLKSGHRGFYLKTAAAESFSGLGAARPAEPENWSARELWAPAFVVSKLASATGSGDSSIAGLLSAFLRGLTIEEGLKVATCCGLQNVLVLDAVSGIHSWEETTDMIKNDLPLIDVDITTAGWNWSPEHKLWLGTNDPLNPF